MRGSVVAWKSTGQCSAPGITDLPGGSMLMLFCYFIGSPFFHPSLPLTALSIP